ncbi:hypothetical protein [Sulfurovum sp.]|uniref:ATP-grasp domain-containing protein n=1 Tax=Sulfurovum sp. TaxID=1969726 RepID=UPI0025E206D0|nr:hypothetical protein [Sulfurovum sp.]
MKRNILFIRGIPDDRKITVTSLPPKVGMLYQITGSANISNFVDHNLISPWIITFDIDPKQKIDAITDIHAVFNEISDPDTHKITLLKTEALYKAFADKVPFFNAPSSIAKTTRDNIYNLLHEVDGLHVPKTVKLQPKSASDVYDTINNEGFDFPVIFRKAGDHNGISTLLITDKSEPFYAFPLDGRDYYLTQFVEYADNDSTYVKYRLIVVDGEVFLRHALFGDSWMMHSRSQFGKEKSKPYKMSVADRFTKEIKPLIQPTVTEIHQRLGLDYFGIDCHIDDKMNLLIFEVNATMNVFIELEESVFKDLAEMARQALMKMLISKRNN